MRQSSATSTRPCPASSRRSHSKMNFTRSDNGSVLDHAIGEVSGMSVDNRDQASGMSLHRSVRDVSGLYLSGGRTLALTSAVAVLDYANQVWRRPSTRNSPSASPVGPSRRLGGVASVWGLAGLARTARATR